MFYNNNLSLFMLLDAFESSCIRIYYYTLTDVFTLIITSSMIYMFMNLFFFFFLKSNLTFSNTNRNIVFLGYKFVTATLYDVVATYFTYKYNIFYLFISYVFIYIFLNNFISLSLILFANIVFLFKSTISNNNNKILSLLIILLPSIFFKLLILFEMVLAGIQSYIFIVLCLIYLKDSLYLH